MTEAPDRYNSLMSVVRDRMTSRAFDPDCEIPNSHYELILEAARHAPSGANAQPWHYIVVTESKTKDLLAERFKAEQKARALAKMKFPTPNYEGIRSAPGVIVIVADFRYVKAFPVLNDDSEIDRMYRHNAERILLQSVAASVMSAHLAASALGYAVWWVTAIGQQAIQQELKPVLAVPDELDIIDIMCFGPPLKAPYKRWKKKLDQILHWDRFDPALFPTDDQIDTWIREHRHHVMYRDESRID